MEYISHDERLEALAIQLGGAGLLAIDTEAAGYHRYHDRICLFQISTRTDTWVVDTLAVNVVGPSLLAAAAVPHLEATRGSIINISSTLAQRPAAGLAHYAASKAALEHLTRCWALELAPKGIRVNAVAAGPVETGFLRERMGLSDEAAEAVEADERRKIPLGRRGAPEDVAAWVVALAGSRAGWITGQVFGVDGGFALA